MTDILRNTNEYYITSNFSIEKINNFRKTFSNFLTLRMNKVESGTIFMNIRYIRSIYLYLIRNFSIIIETKIYYESKLLMFAAYKKTYDISKELFNYIIKPNILNQEIRYAHILLNNLKKFRKLFIKDILMDYSKLPGHLPMCIRSYIMSFIIPDYLSN